MIIVPVILSGGVGSRLWPLSRKDLAKQLAPVLEGETLFQRTLQRFSDETIYARPIVVSGAEQRFVVRDQIEAVGMEADILLEPEPRDTLAAIMAAAIFARDRDNDPIVLIAPSDHLTPDLEAFGDAVTLAGATAAEGRIVTFGLQPRYPATGYGYIRPGDKLASGARAIAAFVEKPDEARAEALITEGCLWNAGLFCFRASVAIDEASAQNPDVVAVVEKAVATGEMDLGALRLAECFSEAEKVSFDIAVMEKTERAAVAPVDFPWSDIGDWRELWAVSDKDDRGNVALGDATLEDCTGVFVRGDNRLVCALGLKDMVIVDTPDALLVADRSRAQDVKKIVTGLRESGAWDHLL